jgi:hypothetical protein
MRKAIVILDGMKQGTKFTTGWTLLAASVFLLASCQKQKSPSQMRTAVVRYVDSVWTKGPGEINTLQTDKIYFGRTTDGSIQSSKSRISVGDSFVYIYRKDR